MTEFSHQQFMKRALQLAALGKCTVSPNPMVGCVIVRDQKIVGEGFHQKAGEAHAEIIALQNAGENARDATLYVTLEPCCHFGRTPPCTNALLKSGVKKIVVACLDPNPLVAGKGVQILRDAGIDVEVGVCEAEAIALNEIFFYYIQNKKPFVICKWAMSLDGKTSVNQNDDKRISGIEAQIETHQLREQVDSILIGANTARDDNPELTARKIPSHDLCDKQPIRIILCGNNPLPAQLKIFDLSSATKTILVTTEKNKNTFHQLQSDLVELLIIEEKNTLISIQHLLTALAEKNITSVLVEGGMSTHALFMQENAVNKIRVTVSPTIIGCADNKKNARVTDFSKIGDDFCFVSEVGYV